MAGEHSALINGIAAAKAGETARARELLSQAIREDPNSVMAWLWLGSVLDTPQARAFCLQQVLARDPSNAAALRGLAAMARVPSSRRAAEAASTPPSPAGPLLPPDTRMPEERPALGKLRPAPPVESQQATLPFWSRPRFWKVVVLCLGVIALILIALLIYTLTAPSPASDSIPARPGSLKETPAPHRTLRPTFTPGPAGLSLQGAIVPVGLQEGEPSASEPAENAPSAGASPLPPPLPTFSPTALPPMLPTFSPTPLPAVPTDPPTQTPLPVRRSAKPASGPAPTATPVPRPPLPAPSWDPRLNALGVRLEPAGVAPGQWYWRLVEARWADGNESGGKHSIYVEVLDANGRRAVGQPVAFRWSTGSLVLPVEDRSPPDWGVNFAMYAALGSYSAAVEGAPSDRVVAMGLGTADAPTFTVHTCFYLVFRHVQR